MHLGYLRIGKKNYLPFINNPNTKARDLIIIKKNNEGTKVEFFSPLYPRGRKYSTFLVRANDPLIYIGDRLSPPYIYRGVGSLVESELGRTRPARGGGDAPSRQGRGTPITSASPAPGGTGLRPSRGKPVRDASSVGFLRPSERIAPLFARLGSLGESELAPLTGRRNWPREGRQPVRDAGGFRLINP